MPTAQRKRGGTIASTSSPRRKRYKPEAVRAYFQPWARGEEAADGEQRAFCPLCEDPDTSATPSAQINMLTGDWHCMGKCGEGGSVFDLVQEVQRETGRRMREVATTVRVPVRRAPVLPPPLDADPSVWHRRLLNNPAKLAYLVDKRGLTLGDLERDQIGWDGQRYTFPIYRDGVLLNVRRYRPGADEKWLPVKGHGTAMFAYTDALANPHLPFVLVAGEIDRALTQSKLGDDYAVITSTGGEGSTPKDRAPVAGREGWIIYDCDNPGRNGAEKMARELRSEGCTVYVVDLTDLGLPFGDGADLSDYWLEYDGTPEALREELERVRSADGDERDEILEAMEAGFLELDSPRNDYTDRLLSEDDVLALPRLQYSVDPFVPRGMITTAFGQPGSFKTFMAQDMGNCIRADIPWHGHAVSPGAVLMLEAEGVEQLQGRIVAWHEHHNSPAMRPFRVLDEPLDLSSPEGAAALVRTVRGMETLVGERVELIIVDPAALYMAGSENEDGNKDLARGLNIVAKYLGVGAIVIMHTNAGGERARGTDHFRMLSGSHVRVERTEDGNVAVVQEKVKNTDPRAVVVRPVPVGSSLAFETVEQMSAAAYSARKTSSEWTSKASTKVSEARAIRQHKLTEAGGWIVDEVTRRPGISKTQLVEALLGRNVGGPGLDAARLDLISSGVLRVETGPRNAVLHYLADGSEVSS